MSESCMAHPDLLERIVDLLGSKGPLTRGDIVYCLQLSRTTIYDSLAKLMNLDVVDKSPVNNNKTGRPKVAFSLNDVSKFEAYQAKRQKQEEEKERRLERVKLEKERAEINARRQRKKRLTRARMVQSHQKRKSLQFGL